MLWRVLEDRITGALAVHIVEGGVPRVCCLALGWHVLPACIIHCSYVSSHHAFMLLRVKPETLVILQQYEGPDPPHPDNLANVSSEFGFICCASS